MTIHEIQRAVKPHKKCSKRHIYRFINQLSIAPAGVRQSPQQYPQDTAARILAHLGFSMERAAMPLAQANRESSVDLLPLTKIKGEKPQHKTKGTK
jgi:hypothetical protein